LSKVPALFPLDSLGCMLSHLNGSSTSASQFLHDSTLPSSPNYDHAARSWPRLKGMYRLSEDQDSLL
jgi:hypothetical protein